MRFTQLVLPPLLALCFSPIHAQDFPCNADGGKALKSLDQLPVQILVLLGRAKTGASGIADIGEKFNAIDVVDETMPSRRLVSGSIGHSCIGLIVEYGGYSHYQKKLQYRRTESVWLLVSEAVLAPLSPLDPDNPD